MTDKDYQWLQDNLQILGNVRSTPDQLQKLYDIHNSITGKQQPVSKCGRCVANIKKRILAEYERVQNLQR